MFLTSQIKTRVKMVASQKTKRLPHIVFFKELRCLIWVKDVLVKEKWRPRYWSNPPGLSPAPLCVVCMELLGLVINDLCFKKLGGVSSVISTVTALCFKPLMKIEQIGGVRGGVGIILWLGVFGTQRLFSWRHFFSDSKPTECSHLESIDCVQMVRF